MLHGILPQILKVFSYSCMIDSLTLVFVCSISCDALALLCLVEVFLMFLLGHLGREHASKKSSHSIKLFIYKELSADRWVRG